MEGALTWGARRGQARPGRGSAELASIDRSAPPARRRGGTGSSWRRDGGARPRRAGVDARAARGRWDCRLVRRRSPGAPPAGRGGPGSAPRCAGRRRCRQPRRGVSPDPGRPAGAASGLTSPGPDPPPARLAPPPQTDPRPQRRNRAPTGARHGGAGRSAAGRPGRCPAPWPRAGPPPARRPGAPPQAGGWLRNRRPGRAPAPDRRPQGGGRLPGLFRAVRWRWWRGGSRAVGRVGPAPPRALPRSPGPAPGRSGRPVSPDRRSKSPGRRVANRARRWRANPRSTTGCGRPAR